MGEPSQRPSVHADQVFLMENHDDAYRIWRDAGVRNKALVHVDAHHDMWWIPDGGPVTIANFICRALQEGLVGAVYWVVPDGTWHSRGTRSPLLEHLRTITKRYPGAESRFDVRPDRISTLVLGKPLVVCPLSSLPALDDDVLLDIDTDYLLLPFVVYGETDAHAEIPWCWPDELVERLGARGVRSSLATVVYSVEGGYTPLKWKHLGKELAERLRGSGSDFSLRSASEEVRVAALSMRAGDIGGAEQRYRRAIELEPTWAPPYYHLAQLYGKYGRSAEARDAYHRALALDPSYQMSRDSAGLLYQATGRYEQLEPALRLMLHLDSDDSFALFGLARIATRKKRWSEAEQMLRRSLAVNDRFIDAHRALGEVLARQGRRDEAIREYQLSLKLGLAGERPLDGAIATYPEDQPRLQDSFHCRTYASLAALYASSGDVDRAVNAYRISIGGANARALTRGRLALLYGRQQRWLDFSREAASAIAGVPAEVRRGSRHVRQLVKRARARHARFRASRR